jgi:mono/diheme cytochrome c family protein
VQRAALQRHREHGVRVRARRFALCTLHSALAGLGVAGLSGCTDWAGYDLDYFWGNIPALATLRGSVAYDPYELPRLPAEHTIPVETPIGEVPAPFTQASLDSVAVTLSNPYAPTPDEVVLARGQKVYINQCYACHGPQGAGDGPVVGPGKYPFAPAINGPTTAARSDGYLYGIIAVGRGLMPPYGERIAHLDRWAVVSYLRVLQRQGNPLPDGAAGVPTVVDPPETAAP